LLFAAEACPVTPLPSPAFVPPAPYAQSPILPGSFWYGTDDLWINVYPHSSLRQFVKFPVWSKDFDPSEFEGLGGAIQLNPTFTVTMKLLDGHTPPLQNLNRTTFGLYPPVMLTSLDLPSTGCWSITIKYKGHELTAVYDVPAK
jgi:hypothetical protein